MNCVIGDPCAIAIIQTFALTMLVPALGGALVLMSLKVAERIAPTVSSVVWLLFAVFLTGWLVGGSVIVFLIVRTEDRPVAIVSLLLQLVIALAFPVKIALVAVESRR